MVFAIFAALDYTLLAISAENPSPVTPLNPESGLPRAILSDAGVVDITGLIVVDATGV